MPNLVALIAVAKVVSNYAPRLNPIETMVIADAFVSAQTVEAQTALASAVTKSKSARDSLPALVIGWLAKFEELANLEKAIKFFIERNHTNCNTNCVVCVTRTKINA